MLQTPILSEKFRRAVYFLLRLSIPLPEQTNIPITRNTIPVLGPLGPRRSPLATIHNTPAEAGHVRVQTFLPCH